MKFEPLWSFDLGDLRRGAKGFFFKNSIFEIRAKQTNEKDELCLGFVFTFFTKFLPYRCFALEAEHITVKKMVCFNVQKRTKFCKYILDIIGKQFQRFCAARYRIHVLT